MTRAQTRFLIASVFAVCGIVVLLHAWPEGDMPRTALASFLIGWCLCWIVNIKEGES